MPLDKFGEANRSNWDERVAGHWASDFYDIEGFKSGKSPLYQIDIDAVGDLTGKSLIHLQCHIGTDTLGLARLGADVTGIDLSGESVKAARRLSEESGGWRKRTDEFRSVCERGDGGGAGLSACRTGICHAGIGREAAWSRAQLSQTPLHVDGVPATRVLPAGGGRRSVPTTWASPCEKGDKRGAEQPPHPSPLPGGEGTRRSPL